MSYQSDSQAESTLHQLRESASALSRPGWLPTGRWGDLDALAAEHQRLIAQRNEVGTERSRLARSFEEQDEKRHDEMTSAMAENRSPVEVEITPPEERKSALAEANRKHAAATEALDRFIHSAIEKIEELTPTMLADLDGDQSHATEAVIEAKKILAEAAATETRIEQMRTWVKRNGGVHERRAWRNIPESRFVAWDGLSAPYVSPEDQIAEQEGRFETIEQIEGANAPDDDSELDVSEATIIELAEWINKDDPTPEQIIDAAGNDPALAQRLLMADQHAHYSPRPEVEKGLKAIQNEAVA